MRLSLAVLLLLLLGSCGDLLSVHPLATKANTTLDSSLLGEWQCVDKDSKGMARVRMGVGDEYDIIWVPGEADGEPLRLVAKVVKLGEARVLDMVAIKERTLSIPGHFFARIEREGDTLKFRWLDSDWLRAQAVAAGGVAHAIVDRKPVVTAGPAALQAFLLKFGLDSRAVSDSMTFRRAPSSARRQP